MKTVHIVFEETKYPLVIETKGKEKLYNIFRSINDMIYICQNLQISQTWSISSAKLPFLDMPVSQHRYTTKKRIATPT